MLRRSAILLAVIFVATAACHAPASTGNAPAPTATTLTAPPEPREPGDHDLTLTWEATQRSYQLHAPPAYTPQSKLPLVVVLPYRGGDAQSMRALTSFDAKADREGFLVAYPNGVNRVMNALICCGTLDDVGFIRALVQHLVDDWGADADRVYATGISNGGDMSARLTVDAPGMFAAVAPVAGGFVGSRVETDSAFRPSRPVSVVSFVGGNDVGTPQVTRGLDIWQQRLGCTVAPVEWVDAAQTVFRFTGSCPDGSTVVSYTVRGMGHQWPGGTQTDGMGNPGTAVNAVDVMWAFFTEHARRP
jgi:polyhydroxybutyrate depolymerase